jgi:hypothetical protein
VLNLRERRSLKLKAISGTDQRNFAVRLFMPEACQSMYDSLAMVRAC